MVKFLYGLSASVFVHVYLIKKFKFEIIRNMANCFLDEKYLKTISL